MVDLAAEAAARRKAERTWELSAPPRPLSAKAEALRASAGVQVCAAALLREWAGPAAGGGGAAAGVSVPVAARRAAELLAAEALASSPFASFDEQRRGAMCMLAVLVSWPADPFDLSPAAEETRVRALEDDTPRARPAGDSQPLPLLSLPACVRP